MNRAFFTLVAAGLFAAAALAEDKFTIKLKTDTKGDILQVTETDAESGKTKITFMGQVQPKDEDSNFTATFKEEILEKEQGKKAGKMKLVFQKVEAAKDGKKLTVALIGKEVLVLREGKTVKFTVDGKPAEGDDETFLKLAYKGEVEQDSDIEKIILPKEAVALNGTWKLDMDAIAKDFAKDMPFTLDAAKSSGTGKLLKAYKKDGKQFGAFEVEMALAVTKVGMGPAMIDLDNSSKVKLTVKFDGCIDGSVQTGVMAMEMEMKMTGGLKTPDGNEVKLDVNATKKSTRTQEDLTGKK